MKNILFVIFDFIPSGSAEATILLNIIQKLVDENIRVEVLTTDSERSHKNREEIVINGKSILIHRFFCHRNIDFHSRDISIVTKAFWATERIIDKILMRIGKLFYYPSIANRFALALKQLDVNKYDSIISVGGFFETFVGVDRAIGKKNNTLRYMYQLDPIANNSLYPLYTIRNRIEFEKRISKEDCVVFACNMLKEQKIRLGINVSNLCEVEFPGIRSNSTSCSKIRRKTVAYVGSFYKDIREPMYLFELFSRLSTDYKLVVAGTGCEDEIERLLNTCSADIRRRIDYLGRVNRKEAEEIIKSSEFVVNLGNSDYSFFPSKLFEYMNYRKKIINVCFDNNCPTISLLEKYPEHVNLFKNLNIDDECRKLYKFVDQDNFNGDFSLNDYYREYTSEYVAKRIFNEISKI